MLNYFVKKIENGSESGTEESLRALFELLYSHVEFVFIQIDNDNPYQIFKSLNSTGVDLSEADLIRNFVFMHVPLNSQDQFDDQWWKPFETHFENENGELNVTLISSFFRDFLMMGRSYIPVAGTFRAFEKRYVDTRFDPTELAQTLISYAKLYDVLRGVKPHMIPQVEWSLGKVRALRTSTAYPLMLRLLDLYEKQLLNSTQLVEAVELTAGFILRRYAASMSSRAYGYWFINASNVLKDQPIENLRRFYVEYGFPTDEGFKMAFAQFPWYERDYARVVLESLERASKHKEPPDLSKATIEHIMPQSLSDLWKEDLGDEAESIHAKSLNTIGNLTLSAYNTELRNHPFAKKRKYYEESNLHLNHRLAKYEQWGAEQIAERAASLAEDASRIWKGPN